MPQIIRLPTVSLLIWTIERRLLGVSGCYRRLVTKMSRTESELVAALSNDDVTSQQLQGHTGTIVECSTCHGTAMDTQSLSGVPRAQLRMWSMAAFMVSSVKR
mgnify:CR=1 FL=1